LWNDDNGDGSYEAGSETLNSGKTVYLDTNNNGKLDSGERSVVTDQYGRYQFSNVAPGSYHVRRVLPSGYIQTTLDLPVTAANGVVSQYDIGSTARGLIYVNENFADGTFGQVFVDANKNGTYDTGDTYLSFGRLEQIALPAGTYRIAVEPTPGSQVKSGTPSFYDVTVKNATKITVTFTLDKAVAPGTVSGRVYRQNNGGETPVGISNDHLFADLNNNGVLDDGEPTAVTDVNGYYAFSLQPGSYRIVVQKPASLNPINYTSGYADITVTTGQTTTVNWQFADNGAYPAKITGQLWNDDNFDKVLDNGETVNGNRTVYIDANHNGKLDAGEKSTTTDNNGVYVFTGLNPGTYDVKRVLPDSTYRITTSTAPVTVAAGQTVTFNIGSTSKPA